MSNEHGSFDKYFARYAEPEAKLAQVVKERYGAAIAVPLCREEISFLDGYRAALQAAPERVLLIAIVNGAEGARAEVHATNQRLLSELERRFPERETLGASDGACHAWLGRAEFFDVLVLDRASEGVRLPRGEGVGLARKIGGDLAAALWRRGHIGSARIACSDADATLPSDYFARLTSAATNSSAQLWPFRHVASGDAAVDRATTLYEVSLRYYVLGLAAARSPYAYQSVGSSLSFEATAYAGVRGFPKREAAEDFYLLDKLAKIAPLERLAGEPIALTARASERVPFGTGRRTGEIVALCELGQHFELYSPEIFSALAAVITGLEVFSVSGDPSALGHAVNSEAGELAPHVLEVLARLKTFDALTQAKSQAPVGAVLRRRVHTWFDALRTLRFVHLLRDACLPSIPWHDALLAAPFVVEPFRDGMDAEKVCARLALLEAELPASIGPTVR